MTQKCEKQENFYPKMWVFLWFFFIHQLTPSIRNFENIIPISLLMCNREFTFCSGLIFSAISFISYPKRWSNRFNANFRPKNMETKYLQFWTQKYGIVLDFIPKILDEHPCTFLLEAEADREHFFEHFVTVRGFKIVRYVESSLNRGFVKPREFIKNLLARIQGTRYLVHYTRKFVMSGVRYKGIQLYFI